MLKKITFSNFYSFHDESEISFEMGRKPAHSLYDIDIDEQTRINKVVAVVGANGSGKTQLIKPIAFLSWFISSSFLGKKPDDDIPFKPHCLSESKSTHFEVIFDMEGAEYRYQLEVTPKRVLSEALYKKTSHLFSYVFIRSFSEDLSHYQVKQKGFGFPQSQAESIRGNASLISAAHSYDTPLASQIAQYVSGCEYNLCVSGRKHYDLSDLLDSAEFFYKNTHLSQQMNQMMCAMDLGLESISIRKFKITEPETGNESEKFLPVGRHQSEEQVFELPFSEESNGTQSAFVLLGRILPVLIDGGLAVIDEIDNDLHPHMLNYILELFKFEHTNPHQAQLIFTCHTPEVLNLLQKHQIYLVEKNHQKSEAWRLDDVIGLRADDNLYAKYMAGALSAVPEL